MVAEMKRGWPRRTLWEAVEPGYCAECGKDRDLDVNEQCRDCAFVANAKTQTLLAAPWGLREVRRLHGINGETNRASEEKKAKHRYEQGE